MSDSVRMTSVKFEDAFPTTPDFIERNEALTAYAVPLICTDSIPPTLAIEVGGGYDSAHGMPRLKHSSIGELIKEDVLENYSAYSTETVLSARSVFERQNVDVAARFEGYVANAALQATFGTWHSAVDNQTICIIRAVEINTITALKFPPNFNVPVFDNRVDWKQWGDQYVWRVLKGGRLELYLEVRSEQAEDRRNLAVALSAKYKGGTIDSRYDNQIAEISARCTINIRACANGMPLQFVNDLSSISRLLDEFKRQSRANPVPVSFFTVSFDIGSDLQDRLGRARRTLRAAQQLRFHLAEATDVARGFGELGTETSDSHLLDAVSACQAALNRASRDCRRLIRDMNSNDTDMLDDQTHTRLGGELDKILNQEIPFGEKKILAGDLEIQPQVRVLFGKRVFMHAYPRRDLTCGPFSLNLSHAGQLPYICEYKFGVEIRRGASAGTLELACNEGFMRGWGQHHNAEARVSFAGSWNMIEGAKGHLIVPRVRPSSRHYVMRSGFQDDLPRGDFVPVRHCKLVQSGETQMRLIMAVDGFEYYEILGVEKSTEDVIKVIRRIFGGKD
ncbi:MAG: hypothetical protein IT577_10920 [Verrucomicrobiae bacterium]|nr:hypothetical protein [Verrucomicrobiae bacterium]